MPRAPLIGLLALVACATPSLVQAQSRNCAPREAVIEKLTTTYGEVRKSMGLAANNGMVEVFASDTTGSWTITLTMANGITCLVASGQSFEAVDEVLPTQAETL